MKNLILTALALILTISISQAQEFKVDKGQNINIKLKDGKNPAIYVDGKKFDFPIELIDTDQIANVSVVKGKKALEEYNSKNGVILITTKKNANQTVAFDQDKKPLIFIDGKKSTDEKLAKISPDQIERIDVYKGEKAMEKYNAPNGAIVVILKKDKK